MWYRSNLDLVLLICKFILSLPRLGLSPMFPISEVPIFSTPSQDTLLYSNDSVYQVGLSHAPMVRVWMMLSELITKVHVSCFPFYLKVLLFQLIVNPVKAHIHGFFNSMVPLMMTSAVEFSVMILVACCGCPISLRVILIALIPLAL